MRPAPLVIYHANCYDGFTAAWVFDKFYKKSRTIHDLDAEYFPAHYGEKPPNCAGRDVYLLDFCYARDVMINDVILPSNRTFVFDHHQTSEASLKGIIGEIRETRRVNRVGDKIVFDMQRSGAGITFDELSTAAGKKAGFHLPTVAGRSLWIVDYVEDRDIWKHALPLTKEFTAYMGTRPMTFEEWDAIQASDIKDLAAKGSAVLDYIAQYGKKANEQARFEQIADWKVPVVNMPYMNCSEHLHELLTVPNNWKEQPAFVASYFRTAKGEYQFSLRSQGDFDVSEVAKKFGGGGHKHAAGFKLDVLPWEKVAILQKANTRVEAEDEASVAEVATSGKIPVVATPDGDDAIAKLGERSV